MPVTFQPKISVISFTPQKLANVASVFAPQAPVTRPGATANVVTPTAPVPVSVTSSQAQAFLAAAPAAPGPAATKVLDAKSLVNSNFVYEAIYAKTQDPNYHPTLLDLIEAANAGIPPESQKWALSTGDDTGAPATSPETQNAADEAAVHVANQGFDPNSVLSNYGSIAAYDHETGHTVSSGEVRAFYTAYYLKLGAQVGLL